MYSTNSRGTKKKKELKSPRTWENELLETWRMSLEVLTWQENWGPGKNWKVLESPRGWEKAG